MNVINSKYYLIISAEVECGIVFYKHIDCTQENIKKAKNKNLQGSLDMRNYQAGDKNIVFKEEHFDEE